MERSSGATRGIGHAELVEQMSDLGVEEGGVLVVHTSFRTLRPVAGGPAGLIDALRTAVGPEGTLVMPSWGADGDTVFDPATTPVSPDLGVTADLFWRMPGVQRSTHPMAFAALGPRAATILADPLPRPPHRPESPIGRAHELDARILLLGVGHDANTTIHLAEILAKVPYGVPKHCTILEDGRPRRIDFTENDHCCQRFALVDGWMRSRELQADGRVGYGDARLMRAQDVVAVVRDRLLQHPVVFLHERGSGCAECDAARDSVPERVRAELEARGETVSDDQRTTRLLERDIAATIGDGGHAATVRELALGAARFAEGDDLRRRIVEEVQQYFHDTFVDTTWPTCPLHRRHPLWFDGNAWRCEQDGVAVAALGELGVVRHDR